jgi:hypothetical protein
MAAVIHSLWEKGDRNPVILPSHVPIDDPRVQFELTRYLTDNWVPVIEKDVDGPSSLPLRLDGEVPNLGKLSACRRVARTIYLGSAPTMTAANRGLEDHLYQDGPRYWYSTQPTVTKLAEDRAEQLKRDNDKVVAELEVRLRVDLQKRGDFSRVHSLPRSGQDVPDDLDARLVVLGTDYPYSKDSISAAETQAKAILATRGSAPRLYANTLVFLAVDKTRLQDLDEAVRRYLAWRSILEEKNTLDLSPHQQKQAETQVEAASSVVDARLPEAYQWLLVPTQASPSSAIEWQAIRLQGADPLAVRASKKLKNDELLITSFAATRLRMELDRVPLWRGDHVAVRQLVDDFARYPYLPRLRDPAVMVEAIESGLGLLNWTQDSFAMADSFDEAGGRYRGLRSGRAAHRVEPDSPSLLVRAEVAQRQLDAERAASGPATVGQAIGGVAAASDAARTSGALGGSIATPAPAPRRPRRYHGTVTLDATRVGRDASRIADEVITHLGGSSARPCASRSRSKRTSRLALPRVSCARSPRTAARSSSIPMGSKMNDRECAFADVRDHSVTRVDYSLATISCTRGLCEHCAA